MTISLPRVRPRLALISRIVAALIGGYALASVFSIFLSFLLPSDLPEAVLGASLFSFAVYTAAIVWAFAAASAARAWLGLLIPGACMGLLSFALRFAGSAT